MSYSLRLSEDGVNRSTSGGKADSLNELKNIGVNVPNGFVITTDSFQEFINNSSIEDFNSLIEDCEDMNSACGRIREEIHDTPVPDDVEESILDLYDETFEDEETRVAVRSSANSEDTKEASFAGQQDTYLNVSREDLINHIRKCWASLFTERASVYRDRHDISHSDAKMAVIVQEMVDADVSGVLFTKNPSTGDDEVVIESTWGLGEAVVSGEVTPDKYVLDSSNGEVIDRVISQKKVQTVWNGDETVTEEVPEDKKEKQVLRSSDFKQLHNAYEKIVEHYDEPQDVEWAVKDDQLYILQSRPITSLEKEPTDLATGLGASPGSSVGNVKLISDASEINRIEQGDVMVTEFTTPDMVPAMERSSAVVTDQGGMTSHAAIVSRELGVPSVVGTTNSTDVLRTGDRVEVDGDQGVIRSAEGVEESADESESNSHSKHNESQGKSSNAPSTGTKIKVNVSLPQAAEKASNAGSDGVGLLRLEHLILSLGETPEHYIENYGRDEFIQELKTGIKSVADHFTGQPVRVRTLDAPTDEFRELLGGNKEPTESNPMLGYRGMRRSFDSEAFECQLSAVRQLREEGYDNIEIMFPLINDANDVRRIISKMNDVGLNLNSIEWGVMIETPASALSIGEIVDQGVDFVSFGTNDLTQYTLATDRNNELVADRFNDVHPAVLQLIKQVTETCRENGVDTSICGEAASKDEMIEHAVKNGVTSLSVNIDAVRDARDKASQVEKRMMLDNIIDD